MDISQAMAQSLALSHTVTEHLLAKVEPNKRQCLTSRTSDSLDAYESIVEQVYPLVLAHATCDTQLPFDVLIQGGTMVLDNPSRISSLVVRACAGAARAHMQTESWSDFFQSITPVHPPVFLTEEDRDQTIAKLLGNWLHTFVSREHKANDFVFSNEVFGLETTNVAASNKEMEQRERIAAYMETNLPVIFPQISQQVCKEIACALSRSRAMLLSNDAAAVDTATQTVAVEKRSDPTSTGQDPVARRTLSV